MSHSFVMTVTGPDRPDLSKALAHASFGFDAVWDRSQVIKLEGCFAAVVLMSVAKAREAEMKAALAKEFPDLTFSYSDPIKEYDPTRKIIALEAVCPDRPGLIRDINSRMLEAGLKVVHMESRRYEVFPLGQAVFSAKLDIEVPEKAEPENVIQELEAVHPKMRVNSL